VNPETFIINKKQGFVKKITKTFDVICIGAALVDIVAQVERHPLEDDEVFVSDLLLFSGGAAANTAAACGNMGLNAAFIGKIGYNDTFGMKILNDFKSASVNTTLIKYSKEKSTGSAYIALDKEGDRRIYAHSGAANSLSKKEIIAEDIIQSKIIYLSSLKNLEPFIEAAKIARKNKIPIILNPGMLIIEHGFDKIRELIEKVDILILSLREFKKLLNLSEDELNEKIFKAKANKLFSLGIKVIVITMGEKGAFILSSGISELIPSIKVNKVIDTTGAGDAFSAGFLWGFIKNLSFHIEDIKRDVKIGNFVAGKCIQELGARNGIPNKDEMIKFFSELKK
jgi:ribokinase